jgi:uncharacterized protein
VVFHVMVKPTGAKCNLNCQYCFYLPKEDLYPDGSFRMSEEVLEEFTRQYFEANRGTRCVEFAWQGGEPTLMGLDFFRKAVELQKKYAPSGVVVSNAFQTNGTLLDDEWCKFFHEQNFLVGISLDGPEELHNRYRVDKQGRPTFSRVMAGVELLRKHKVEFNILCLLNNFNADHPEKVYRFFAKEGFQFWQFIPGVGRAGGRVTPWSVKPRQYGRFLTAIFQRWIRKDVGRIFIQQFEVFLGAWLGQIPTLCSYAPSCGRALALEHNGDLYSCDHFVTEENFLGNILKQPLAELVRSPKQRAFGREKANLPAKCKKCEYLFACHGGCPKDRFLPTEEGIDSYYLCRGLIKFFQETDPYFRLLARQVAAGQEPARVMEVLRKSR